MTPAAVDAAILKALGLEAADTKMTSHGGSGFSSTFKLTTTDADGETRNFFVKTGTGANAEVMFRGEHASLNAISGAVPDFCPRSHAHGALSNGKGYFLATDFLDLGASVPKGSGVSFAAKLAKLHTTPAPPPASDEGQEGEQEQPLFGFPVTTCCGETPQDNSWRASWADFYADNRLRSICRAAEKNNGPDRELTDAVETTASKVVPRLVGDDRIEGGITPVVVHGDLWSGNHSTGQIAGRGGLEEVVFDASAVYGHSEYELGIMKMFGGFGSAFFQEYEKLVPKAEPKKEFDDRVQLYELYHHLNHYALFGGSYRSGAMSIMKRLISKYGGQD